jgi:hypothetical protein
MSGLSEGRFWANKGAIARAIRAAKIAVIQYLRNGSEARAGICVPLSCEAFAISVALEIAAGCLGRL